MSTQKSKSLAIFVAAAAVLVMSAMVVTPWMSSITTTIPEAYAHHGCKEVGEIGECLKTHKKIKDKK